MLALVLLSCVVACSRPDGVVREAPSRDGITAVDGRLIDALGREVLLHGVNARVEGIFDVTFDDGRTPLEPIPPFVAEDCQFIAEQLGMNFLRLPINWSAVEPQRGIYEDAYLEKVVAVVETCWKYDVWTLVDLHQDAYSKEIGEDGAPLWAIVPPPEQLLQGPLHDLGERRVSGQTLAAFESFYNNIDGLQDAYSAMAAHVAARIAAVPGVMGLEIQNEPVLLTGLARLDEFHARVGRAVRRAAPALTLVFEPNSLRNWSDKETPRGAFPFDDAVYAPHLYTGVFQGDWKSGDTARIEASAQNMRTEAELLGSALMVGEFGHTPNDSTGLEWIGGALDAMDAVHGSWAFWVYEEWSQGSWGLYGSTVDPPARGALRDGIADILARPFPVAVDGTLDELHWDEATTTLSVKIGNPGPGKHVLSAPVRAYPDGAVIECGGTAAEATPTLTGRIAFPCMAETVTLRPASP